MVSQDQPHMKSSQFGWILKRGNRKMTKIFWKRLAAFFDWVAFGVGAAGAAMLGLPSGKLDISNVALSMVLFMVAGVLYWVVTAILQLAASAGQQVD